MSFLQLLPGREQVPKAGKVKGRFTFRVVVSVYHTSGGLSSACCRIVKKTEESRKAAPSTMVLSKTLWLYLSLFKATLTELMQ